MTYVNCLGCGCVDCPSYSLAIDCPMCGYRCVPVPVADMLTAPYNDICNLYMHVPGMDIYIYPRHGLRTDCSMCGCVNCPWYGCVNSPAYGLYTDCPMHGNADCPRCGWFGPCIDCLI